MVVGNYYQVHRHSVIGHTEVNETDDGASALLQYSLKIEDLVKVSTTTPEATSNRVGGLISWHLEPFEEKDRECIGRYVN